ncbi:glycosyltransferase family 2 protein [Bacteroides ovatus]|uniref:glycosyltransferase family 2 protein n=1 Tax=Bacteroides ovatus TaxID=28116 RepID=UPI0031453634
MKVSVITVTYNASTSLEETMLSVFNQNYSHIEYIIIDGGSIDGTVDIISKYANKLSYWVSEPDKGVYDAMNKALKIATGDFLIFMGADDLFYTNDVIQNVVNQISDMYAVYYGSVLFKGIGTKHLGKFNKIKWATTNISHQAIFYPRIIYKTHSYDTQYKIYADYAYNLNLLKEKVDFVYVDEIITLYNMTGMSADTLDETFQKDYRSLLFESVGILAYYVGKCIRCLYFYKESLKKYL